MEQSVLVSVSLQNKNKSLNTQAITKQERSKYQAEQNPTYQIDSLKKEKENKKLFAKADTCPRTKLSKSQTLILDGVDVPDNYFTLPDTACISPFLVLNQNAIAKERRSWVFFKKCTTEAAETAHAELCCLWICAKFIGR